MYFANDVEHFFWGGGLIYHLHMFFSEMSLHVFCPCFNWIVFWVLLLSFAISLCILDTSHLLNSWFANIFSQFVVCLFILLTGLFQRKKFFILIKLNLSIFLLWAKPLLAKEPMNSLVNSRSQEFNPACCLQSFRVLHFIFKFVIHLELIFG